MPTPPRADLTDETCVVTGASRGIGLAIARALAHHGARVAMLARGYEALALAAATLGTRATPIACDVASAEDVARAIAAIRGAFGAAPSIIVNNAGAFAIAPVDAVDPETFAASLDTNLVAPLRFIRAFLEEMRARGRGHIVTIGSVADRQVFAGNAAYAASKHAMRALHEVIRLETAGSGVRTTLVAPGPVDTTLWDPIDPDHREGFTPRARMLEPEAVAAAVVYAVTQPPAVNVDELRLSRA